jgi:type IV/VI secretion system ImpK/VasF family protein
LTGKVDEDYGPPKSSQAHDTGPHGERGAGVDVDGHRNGAPRQSRPFRGWGAAESDAGSVWARFIGWIRSLFSRGHSPADADALWDTPVVASRGSNAPPAIDESDLDSVWTPRQSPLDGIDWKSLQEQPRRGFFARLFSRGQADAPFASTPSRNDFVVLKPADSDFADDAAAGTAPADADFASPAEVDLDKTAPTPMPAVPRPTDAGSLFRDARDDFDEAKLIARSSEYLIPPDDDDKTDEFEIVPIPAAPGATAETRMVPGFFGRMFGKKAEEGSLSAQRAAAAAAEDKMPFVLAKFRSFYNEVIRDKNQKSDVIAGFATAVMGAGGAASESDPDFAAQLLSKRLSEMLELQAAESNWTGGDAARYYPEAQYAMVALADETFSIIDWPGRPAWHKYMLEPRMYGTRGAEIEFFKRIDKLLKDAPDEKGARDLARLYLMVIAAGYRGKFRVPNVRRPLAEYRRRLYEYSHASDPLELYARDRRVFPQAAAHTLVSNSVGRFTPAQKWIAVVLVLSVLYIGVSHYAWRTVSADLRDVMSRIQSSISQPSGSSTTAR